MSKPAPLALVDAAPVVTEEQIDLVRRTVAAGATDAELKLYLYDCQRQGVHPLDRLLHYTKRGGKYTPVTSIDLMRMRAADTGEYAGSDDAVFVPKNDTHPLAATVTVWRLVQTQRCAFTATARWSEYCPPTGQDHMWKKMPHTMLAKCAEALALRKGFPRQLAGLYAREEMDQAGPSTPFNPETGEVLEEKPTPKLPTNQGAKTPDPTPKDQDTISDMQIRKLFGRAGAAGFSRQQLKDYMKEVWGYDSLKDVPKAKFTEILSKFEERPSESEQL